MSKIEFGYINTVNDAKGTVTIIQPHRNGNITGEMPVFSHFGEFKPPSIGDMVAFVKWGDGYGGGVVLGGWWSEENPPPAGGFYKDTGNGTSMAEKGGCLAFSDSGGEISVKEIIEKLNELEERVAALGG